MALAALGDELSCSICLNLYTEPVSLRCGHNFCWDCIVTALDTQKGSGVYSCPVCREEYVEWPLLEKNRKLCNIVDNFRSSQQKEEKNEILCTYCVDSPVGAVKTCLQCETSMCDKHLTAHNKTVDHVLIEPTSSFSSKKCSIHKKLLEYYCSQDAVCLCTSCCLVGEHKGHEVEPLEEALEKKKEKLKNVLEKLSTKRETIEQKMQNLQDHKTKTQEKADDEKKRVSALFEDIRRQLEVQEQRVLSEISRQVEEVLQTVSDLIKQLEIQKNEIPPKMGHIEKLCNMIDPITALQDPDSDTDQILQDEESDTGDQNLEESSFPDLDDFMISLVLHRSITDLITNMQLKNNFCTQNATMLLDEKTVHNLMDLSDDLRTAAHSETRRLRPNLPQRFITYNQVMSVESFSHGRHYWEVEVGDCGVRYVAVCYPSIKRDGKESGIAYNNKSWGFCIMEKRYSCVHDSQYQRLNFESPVQRLGIYLDYEGGRLSFYQLSDTIRHLHTFTTTFTEPLHAAFYLRMALAALGDELSCSICLNLYTEPVSLRCGHNFCRDCIVTALDTQEGSGVYSCPECREEYVERPTLEKNRKLCNIVENFRSTQQKEEKSEILCTYCLHSLVAAVKTCLQCEISMCAEHLAAHNKRVDHVLIEPTLSFSSKKCSIHKDLLKFYCSQDAVCLCVSCCLVGKHKGHEVELLEEALEKKKEKLRNVIEKITKKREKTEQKILNLQDHKRKSNEKADDEKKRVTALFEDIRRQLEVQEQRVLIEISRQVEEVSLSVILLTKQLEIQKDELSRKIGHFEKLCKMTDPITVLQDQESDADKVLQDQESDTDEVLQDEESDTDVVLQDEESDTDVVLQDEESDTGDENVEESSARDLDNFMISLLLHRSITDLITNMQLKTNFNVQDTPDLLLDEKTAYTFVSLSDDLRTAFTSETEQIRPEIPQRFTEYSQVMSMESFSHGRHYWEVEVGDCGEWDVGVCYPSIKRDGEESGIGSNKNSWSFGISENKYSSIYNFQIQELNLKSPVQRLGLYLDYEGGRLSYYQLSDPIRHLLTFTTTFTEPLHTIFSLDEGAWVKLASPVFSIKP